MNIDFAFEIRQAVKIKALNVIGIVVGFYYGETGTQYQVSYFLNGEKKVIYLYEDELSGQIENAKIGFTT